jgi:hypothetical protein
MLKNGREPTGEVLKTPAERGVPRQLLRVAGGLTLKLNGLLPGRQTEPNEAEVHQLGVLDVVEVRRVGEDAI